MSEVAAPVAEKVEKGVHDVVTTLEKVSAGLEAVQLEQAAMKKSIEDATATRYPHGVPGSFNIRKGENSMGSRPYSLMTLTKALSRKAANDLHWADHAKVELELSEELRKEFADKLNYVGQGILVPLGSELLPTNPTELADGTKLEGMSRELVSKCQQLMAPSMHGFDPDEYDYMIRKGIIRKDLSANTATTGGTLVGLASQGELIEQLKAMEVFSRAGAQQIDLPPQGRIRFPKQTGSVTIAGTTEGASITESTPATSALELNAKAYSGLVDIPDELMKFATSIAVEAWLRSEFLRELALKTDRDMINGAGGQSIQGVVNYSGLNTVLATTVATNGNTLGPADPTRLFSAIADQNAPVDRGFFYALTNTLWGGLTTRRADAVTAADGAGAFMFSALTQLLGGTQPQKSLNGYPVLTSTQVPTNRVKGSGTTLTMLLAGVGAEWIIARAGVVELAVTNSDSTKFQNRITTMRGTVYMDAGPRHEESFGMIDTLLNS